MVTTIHILPFDTFSFALTFLLKITRGWYSTCVDGTGSHSRSSEHVTMKQKSLSINATSHFSFSQHSSVHRVELLVSFRSLNCPARWPPRKVTLWYTAENCWNKIMYITKSLNASKVIVWANWQLALC